MHSTHVVGVAGRRYCNSEVGIRPSVVSIRCLCEQDIISALLQSTQLNGEKQMVVLS